MKLRAVDLGKKFRKSWILKNINLDIDSKRIAILGPSSSGKSTFLSIASGITYPTRGKIFINNHEPYRERDWVLKHVSYMFDKPVYVLSIKLKDVVNIVSDVKGCRDEGLWLAKQLGLDKLFETELNKLSVDQAHIVELWTTLVCPKEIVLLDEPFKNLDEYRVSFILEVIRDLENLLVTTSNPEEAEAIADYIVLINAGTTIWSGSKHDLFKNNFVELIPYDAFIDISEILREINCTPISRVGLNILVSNCSEEKLELLMSRKIITGFKKAGVRSKYVEISSK